MNYSDLGYILVCSVMFLVLDFLFGPKRRPNVRAILWVYIDCVRKIRREKTFCEPRLRRINGKLHVVGYGQHHPVRSPAEGKRLMVRMNRAHSSRNHLMI